MGAGHDIQRPGGPPIKIIIFSGSRRNSDMTAQKDHITVCICTFKRPQLLVKLLHELEQQEAGGLFTYSVVVVDNDHDRSACESVDRFKSSSKLQVEYYHEPIQNISLARNKAVSNATGNLVALIDDDEFPNKSWLLELFSAYRKFDVDGILGPVIPHYERGIPEWVVRGKFYERRTHRTGTVLKEENTRSGNVLLKKEIFDGNMFKPEFGRGGEDQDFFRRVIAQGRRFVWCNEAAVHEHVPKERCTRSFLLKRALLHGRIPQYSLYDYAVSFIAVPVYSLLLPFALLKGQHAFMRWLFKDFHHIGRILGLLGLDVIRERYVTK